MKTRRRFVVVLSVLIGMAFAMLMASVVLLALRWFWATPPPNVILIYELDVQPWRESQPVNMQQVLDAIDERVNPSWPRRARVRQLDGERIEVAVFCKGPDPKEIARIGEVVSRVGTLEFRMLANTRDHKSLIERARTEAEAAGCKGRKRPHVLRDAKGHVVAWWVPVQLGQEASFEDYLYRTDFRGREVKIPESQREVAVRETLQDGQRVLEVLVVKDRFDVTSEYLTDAALDRDRAGKPRVAFTFGSEGARRFGALTAKNLPDDVMEFYRKLGIILNGKLYSAPRIRTTIHDSGVIEGSFTEEEAHDLVRVLNAGASPVPIRLVETRVVDSDQ